MEEKLKELISNYQVSHSLPRQFYTSETLYKMDIEHYWNHSWIWVGHVNQIPNTGDFFLFDYGYESVIVARDKNKDVNALLKPQLDLGWAFKSNPKCWGLFFIRLWL